jgi:hypothetical protein
MTSIISGTDGKCELSADLHEQLIWTKLENAQNISRWLAAAGTNRGDGFIRAKIFTKG